MIILRFKNSFSSLVDNYDNDDDCDNNNGEDHDDCGDFHDKDDPPGLNADEVHAVTTANISPSDPVHLVSIAIIIIIIIFIIIIIIIIIVNHLKVFGQLILPAEEIVVTVVLGVLDPVCTVL